MGEDTRAHFDLEGLWGGLGATIARTAQPETMHTVDTMRVEPEG